MKRPLNIGIIGGGITGLTLACYFSKKGHKPVIFEKDSELGGLISTFELYGTRLEKYYHHIFTGDKHTLELIEEIGLSKRIDRLKSVIGTFYKGKTYPFSTSFDLLKFPHLSFLSKLRLGLATIYLQQCKKWKKFKNKRASDWIKKYMGNEVWQIIWKPLFQGKFGKYYKDIAMSWFWARIYVRSVAKVKGGEILIYPKSSFQEIIDRLAERIIKNKGKIFSNKLVEKILVNEKSGISLVSKGKTYNFDLVLSTVAPPVLANLIPYNFNNFKKQLSEVKYFGNVSTILILKEKLTDCYWTNVLDDDMPFAGIIEHTNFVSPSRYKGKHIVYLSHYTSDPAYFSASKEELLAKYSTFLERVNPKIRSALEDVIIFREAYAQPIITADYFSKIPTFQTPIKSLYQLSMAQIFPEDRGVDIAIREAKKLVDFILFHG